MLTRLLHTFSGTGLPLRFRVIAAGFLVLMSVAIATQAARLPAGQPESSPKPAGPLAGWVIVVDPGHGGMDRGACHEASGIEEKTVNLDVAHMLLARLQTAGATAQLTRSDDQFIDLSERAQIANRAAAGLFISVHVNRIPGHPECFGAQTFYYPDDEAGKRLAHFIQEEIRRIDPDNLRQPLQGRYKVLQLGDMPGVIVEIGFISNERDRRLIRDPKYLQSMTEAITQGVVRYVQAGEPAKE